jgi:hypothetical protein
LKDHLPLLLLWVVVSDVAHHVQQTAVRHERPVFVLLLKLIAGLHVMFFGLCTYSFLCPTTVHYRGLDVRTHANMHTCVHDCRRACLHAHTNSHQRKGKQSFEVKATAVHTWWNKY